MDEAQDLVDRLVRCIESAVPSLHRRIARYDRCKRLELGLDFSRPGDCNCGLDELLEEAKRFVLGGSRPAAP